MKRELIRLKASFAELGRLSQGVADFCDRNGISEKLKYTLQLVCDEWVTNIITHGYGRKAAAEEVEGAPIEVSLELTGEGNMRLVFTDEAPAFNPLELPEPDLTLPVEERPIGGLGVHFIRTKMDRCEYMREGRRNQLILLKKLE